MNPELFLDVSREELNGYFNTLSEDVKGVKDDIADLRVELGGKLDDVKKDTAAIRETTTRIESGTKAANSKLWVVLASLVGIAAVVAAILYFVLGTKETTEQIAGDTSVVLALRNALDDAELDLTEDLVAEVGRAGPLLRGAARAIARQSGLTLSRQESLA